MHWNYREGITKAIFLAGLTAMAFFSLSCPETEVTGKVYGQLFPTAVFCMEALAYGEKSVTAEGKIMDLVAKELPLYSYSISYFGDGMMNRYYKEYVEILMQEAKEGTGGKVTEAEQADTEEDTVSENEGNSLHNIEEDKQTEEAEEENNRLSEEGSSFFITDGTGEADREAYKNLLHTEKVQDISLGDYRTFEALAEKFYTVDKSTYTTAKELNAEKLASVDLKLQKRQDAPQILIYHTHAHEGYADSVAGDDATSVVGVGEQLAQILRNEYGYQVLHHTEQYDGDRDYAYSCALPAIEQILKENPTIEVVIDLHRDSVEDGTKLVRETAGVQAAKFMFFNGLSRVREIGEIGYLPNENLQKNLAFSFQMQKVCEEYYPGLTRKIYLKGYRYNMHLKPRTLLVEVGAQNNTLQEALNACGPIARALAIVLGGEG